MTASITRPKQLDDAARAAVVALTNEVEARDGAPPLSDQALSHLSSARVEHLLAVEGDVVVGYAQLDGSTLEVVADAASTRPLLDAALDIAPNALVWSHGSRSPLGPLLAERGFEQVRALHQMRRPLDEPFEDVPLPADVEVRDFVVGQDEQQWVRVNAAAFAAHREQGSWTIDDLLAREAESWFDPSGFLIAARGGQMIGFHWTKVHSDGIGEVYILGIDPAAKGIKLGAALLVRGLRRLADRGCPAVLLYVDDDNTAAMSLYQRLGFTRFDTDTQWRAGAS